MRIQQKLTVSVRKCIYKIYSCARILDELLYEWSAKVPS